MLIEAVKRLAHGVEGMTLLDIGGGVGAIQQELLRAGLEKATDVDASGAYLKAAQEEAERQGHSDKVSYRHANFVEVAGEIAPADIVTLDRVICCFNDMEELVGLSADKAGKLYGVVYPRDTWWVRSAVFAGNVWLRITRNPFRAFVYHTRDVERVVREKGLERRFYKKAGPWQVVVYGK
jgi:magnesium-protoporphyrin O-methyltransferase